MKNLCSLLALAALACAALVANTAHASGTQTSLTDLWWASDEPGWGVSLNHQGKTVVATFYAYPRGAAGSQPGVWYQATLQQNPSDDKVFSGPLYQFFANSGGDVTTAGRSPVVSTLVGTSDLFFDFIERARFNFTILDTPFNKTLRRFPVSTEDFRGRYMGAAVGTYVQCANNGLVEEPATIAIEHNYPPEISISMAYANGKACVWRGSNYTQSGQMGGFTGTYTCSDGYSGVASAYEMQVTISGFTARGEFTNGTCRWSGRLGGLRRAQ